MSVSEMQFLLRRHGYNYGYDAAENALVGYQLGLTLILEALPKELRDELVRKKP